MPSRRMRLVVLIVNIRCPCHQPYDHKQANHPLEITGDQIRELESR